MVKHIKRWLNFYLLWGKINKSVLYYRNGGIFSMEFDDVLASPEEGVPQEAGSGGDEVQDFSQNEKPQLSGAIDEISRKLDDLTEMFDSKISKDAHLKELNSRLYDNLKQYQDGMLDSFMERVLNDLIRVIRDVENQVAYYPEECSEERYSSLLKAFTDIPIRLADLLYEYDVEPYETEGDRFEPKRQEISSTVSTQDTSLRNTVKDRVCRGWLRHTMSKDGEIVDKVIRKEKVTVYKLEEVKGDE